MIDQNDTLSVWRERVARRAALAAELLPRNKARLFDALAAAGISLVTVRFDGYGDSGQIEDIDARDPAGAAVQLPGVVIEIGAPEWDGSGVKSEMLTVGGAIEQLSYDFLEELHDGWENNEGAYGDFRFDVGKRTISLDYHERYTATDTSEHEF